MPSLEKVNKLELEQSISLKNLVHDLSSEFLEAFGLSQIWVQKFYFDGRYLDITNDFSWKETVIANNHYRDIVDMCFSNIQEPNLKQRFFKWEQQTSVPKFATNFTDKAHNHGINSSVSFSRIQDDYIENYGFGSPNSILELYKGLPSLAEIKMFCLYLREGIHNDCLRNPVLGDMGYAFKPHQPLKNYSLVPLPNSFSLKCNNQDAKLSPKELVCIGLLARGYSQKESARIMNLSPRTIEFHLNQVRVKFNNACTSKLITTFNASPLADVDPILLLASL